MTYTSKWHKIFQRKITAKMFGILVKNVILYYHLLYPAAGSDDSGFDEQHNSNSISTPTREWTTQPGES